MKKQRVIITIKEEHMSQIDGLAQFLDEKGVKDVRILSSIGIIIASMDKQTMKAIENYPTIEKMAVDKEVHIL